MFVWTITACLINIMSYIDNRKKDKKYKMNYLLNLTGKGKINQKFSLIY